MRMQWFEYLKTLCKPFTPAPKTHQPVTGRRKAQWQAAGVVVEAFTKSEARALLKEKLGFRDRLPAGMEVSKP